MAAYRLMRIISALSFLGLGYILVIHPAEILWKISHIASFAWILFIGTGLYLEMILQEKYPHFRPRW